ncbi:MAG: acyl-CoA thioesterase [Labedaea sp.]
MAGLRDILAHEELGADRFRFGPVPSELPRTFGGRIVAQALLAAAGTVTPEYPVHSIHGYFLAPGRPALPAEHAVERVRDGGSFRARQVTATQAGVPIFAMLASFHRGDEGFSHQAEMPDAPTPEEIAELDRTTGRAVRRHPDWHDWELRWVPSSQTSETPAAQRFWIRHRSALPDDQRLHACALAYLSDMGLLRAARLAHSRQDLQGASLDHAVWFLRPARVDEWLLYDQISPSAGFGRGLTQGRLFDCGGRLVAATTQEGLMRIDRRGERNGQAGATSDPHSPGQLPDAQLNSAPTTGK